MVNLLLLLLVSSPLVSGSPLPNVVPIGSGTISVQNGYYGSGSVVNVTAYANPGYVFDHWVGVGTGSYSGTNNPAVVTMDSPVTETAYFVNGTCTTLCNTPKPLPTTLIIELAIVGMGVGIMLILRQRRR